MNRNFSDHDILLKSLNENDYETFSYLYKISRKRLFIIALIILGDIEISRDIVQDFFADLLENKSFENVTALKSYMAQAVRNRALNFKKREKMLSSIKVKLARHREFELPAANNEELKNELNDAIDNLPPMAAKVFLMHYAEHLSYKDIANKLEITTSTVSSHMDRALKGLRSKLKRKIFK